MQDQADKYAFEAATMAVQSIINQIAEVLVDDGIRMENTAASPANPYIPDAIDLVREYWRNITETRVAVLKAASAAYGVKLEAKTRRLRALEARPDWDELVST